LQRTRRTRALEQRGPHAAREDTRAECRTALQQRTSIETATFAAHATDRGTSDERMGSLLRQRSVKWRVALVSILA
jgi:hypothetical protein